MKPNLCHNPLAFCGCRRNVHYAGRFSDGKSAEKAQFDDLALPWVESCEPLQSVVKDDEIEDFGLLLHQFSRRYRGIVSDCDSGSFSFCGKAAAGVVDQNLPHHRGRNRKEMRTVLPFHRVRFHEPQIGFVDKGGGLQGVIAALAGQALASDPAQFLVNQWN